jgi:hypothetical protein
MNPTSRRTARWAALGALCVLAWRAGVVVWDCLHEPRKVRELAAVLEFKQDVIPNQANNRFVFCRDTPAGVGIYFGDTAGGPPRLLCEQAEKGRLGRRFTMLGWSPDDRRLACAHPDDAHDREEVLIFDGKSGELEATVGVDSSLYEFGWLNADAFAYSTRTAVRTVAREADGSWGHRRYFPEMGTRMEDFCAVSDRAVAWRDGGTVWQLDLTSGARRKVGEATGQRVVQLTCVRGVEEWLLNCTDEAGQYLLRLRPNDGRTLAAGRLGGPGDFIRNARWDGRDVRYVSLTNDLAGSAFWVQTGARPEPVLIPWRGGARSGILSGDQVFFAGQPDDEAPGIWTYDLKAGAFQCVFSTASGALKHGLGRPSITAGLTNSLGEGRCYHLWAPARVAPGRKYPLLLAQEHSTWFPYFQMAAHCGYYVAVVDRPFGHTWDGALAHTWAEDVGRLYDTLAGHPNVDTNRVWLYACSRDTAGLSQLVRERPGLARGVILFSPSALPDPAALRGQSLLIVTGQADPAAKRLSALQDELAKAGIAATLFLQEGAQHMPAAGRTERDRARQFVRFLREHN